MSDESQRLMATDVASRLGLAKSRRNSRTYWRGSCPQCDYDGHGFSMVADKGGYPRFFCACGCTADEISNAVEQRTGGKLKAADPVDPEKVRRDQRKRLERALAIFGGAMPLDHPLSEPARLYLASRHIDWIAGCPDLRYRRDCPHPSQALLPALIGLLRDIDGNPSGIQRTFIKQDGSGKLDVDPPKASLGGVWGSCLHLSRAPDSDQLVLGEGMESSAAAGLMLGGGTVWAAMSAGNMRSGVTLPASFRTIIIAGDNDHLTKNGKRPGQEAAREAAKRWIAEGRTVRIAMPRTEGEDFADVLARERQHG